MPQVVDFTDVSTIGLRSSPVAESLAGLRANEARYFKNKYDHVFSLDPASDAMETIDWVHGILNDEREIVMADWIGSPRFCAMAWSMKSVLLRRRSPAGP